MKQAQAAEQPAEGPPQEINENAQLDQYLQNIGFRDSGYCEERKSSCE